MKVAEKTETLELELVRATPEDRAALREMYLSFEPKGACLGLPPRDDPAPWLDRLSPYPNFLAKLGGRVVGHSALCPAGDTGEVAVFVHQDFRGLGLGRRLLSAAVEEARRQGLHRVWGTTELDNVPMLRLAYSLGFVPGEDRSEFYLDVDQPNLVDEPHTSIA